MPLRLVAFDMDGTLVDVPSSWGEIHRFFGDSNEAGLKAFLENRIDDAEFIRSDVRIWWRHNPAITVGDIARILESVPLVPGAKALIEGLRSHGISTAIVSGGVDLLANRIARDLGIDHVLANGFVTDPAGRLTGEGIIRVPIWGKEEVLRGLQERLGIRVSETGSVGNSEIDAGLFRRSRVGIAFLPADDAIRRAASAVVEGRDISQVLGPLLAYGGDETASRPPSFSEPS